MMNLLLLKKMSDSGVVRPGDGTALGMRQDELRYMGREMKYNYAISFGIGGLTAFLRTMGDLPAYSPRMKGRGLQALIYFIKCPSLWTIGVFFWNYTYAN